MKREKKSIVIIIGIIGVLMVAAYALMIVSGFIAEKWIGGILISCTIGVIFVLIIGAIIYTVIERLKEIKGEDEDDISKY